MQPLRALTDDLVRHSANWTAGESPVTALEPTVRRRMLGVVLDQANLAQLHTELAAAWAARVATAVTASYPPAFDWRLSIKVSPVKAQGECGSCVSFACCALVESHAAIEHGVHFQDLSEADLHFCSAHGESCSGWWPTYALDDIKTRGTVREIDFPYSANSSRCVRVPDHDAKSTKISQWGVLSAMSDIKQHLATVGPLVAVFKVYDDFFAYRSGVYWHVSGAHAGYHAVLVVGYSDSERCWIAKNSWGPHWGESGFFKIRYGECGIDETSSDTDEQGRLLRIPMWHARGVILPRSP